MHSPSHGETSHAAQSATLSSLAKSVFEKVSADGPRILACAPGRLDVMGGLAEYTGALVLSATLSAHVAVTIHEQAERRLTLHAVRSPGWGDDSPTSIAFDKLFSEGGSASAPIGEASEFHDLPLWARCCAGAVAEAVHAKLCRSPRTGLVIVAGSSLSTLSNSGQFAALASAVIAALAHRDGVTLDVPRVASVCQAVENQWMDRPVGLSDAVSTLVGEPNVLLGVQCDPCTVSVRLPLSNDLVLVGIDCGATRVDAAERYRRVRVASRMGRSLIRRIVQHEDGRDNAWGGYLSGISVSAYVNRFRDRLPTKLKGKEFLTRFDDLDDALVEVEPDHLYKVRSRTEHHIYEHDRSGRFVKCLSQGMKKNDESAITEAGELMYASHWSYGQRCGLASIETDILVNLLRRQGVEAGIHGAKITGRGCGGVVAVLMRDTERAAEAVENAVQTYESRTGKKATVLSSGLPGVLKAGVHQLS